MTNRLRQLVLLLIGFAFIGGTPAQLARAAAYAAPMVAISALCDMEMAQAGMPDERPMPPCKGMTPDCIKQMGCVTDAALPVRTTRLDIAVRFSAVDYWQARSKLVGVVREPEPLPPRTI